MFFSYLQIEINKTLDNQGEATEWTPYNAELNMQSIKVADKKYKRMSNTEYHVKCKGDGKEPHAREGVEG